MNFTYTALVEQGKDGYGVYSPDVPGCASWGNTIQEALDNFKVALNLHLTGNLEDGIMPPQRTIVAAQDIDVELDVAQLINPTLGTEAAAGLRAGTNRTQRDKAG